jgi:hypothetical protein
MGGPAGQGTLWGGRGRPSLRMVQPQTVHPLSTKAFRLQSVPDAPADDPLRATPRPLAIALLTCRAT